MLLKPGRKWGKETIEGIQTITVHPLASGDGVSAGARARNSFTHSFTYSLIHSFTHFSQFPPDIFKRPPLCFGHDADDKQELEHHHQGKKSKHRASPE